MKIINQIGVLKWYDDINCQIHRIPDFWGADHPTCVGQNKIPMFQVVFDSSISSIKNFNIIRKDTGVSTSILSAVLNTGLRTETNTDSKTVIYPGSMALPTSGFELGVYYCEMGDGVNTWYSETFKMCDDLSDKIKIEWCHNSNIALPVGTIYYDQGYKNELYFETTIGKSGFRYRDVVSERDGKNFKLKQIAYKLHQFEIIAPEWIIDTVWLIRLHDFIKVYDKTIEYDVDEFTNSDPEFTEIGDLASMTISLQTDTVLVMKAQGHTGTLSCDIAPGGCFTLAYDCVAYIVENSAEYSGFYYNNASGGGTTNFVTGDKVLIEDETLGTVQVYEFNGSGYDIQSTVTGDIVFNQNDALYYERFATGGIQPNSLDQLVNGNEVVGQALTGTVVEVYVTNVNDDEQFVGAGNQSTFLSAPGIPFTFPNGAKNVFVKVSNVVCGVFWTSDPIAFYIRCDVDLKGDFDDPTAAASGGVQDGENYALTAGNAFGWPEGLIMQLNPIISFDNDSDALAGLGHKDMCFAVSNSNDWAFSPNGLKIYPDETTTYDSDTDAANAGLNVGDVYALSASNAYSVPGSGFLKKLISVSG